MARPARKHPGPTHAARACSPALPIGYATGSGIDVAPLLEQAGLTQEEIENRNARIGVINQIKFVGLVATALGDELLGFHLVDDFDFREIGLLYYVAASAGTLGAALGRVRALHKNSK